MKCFDIDGFHPISLDSYFKLTFNDNSGEHRLELGNFAVCNLLPNDTYRDALSPHEINLRRRVDKSVFLRVYCRAKSPVAGISIKEHFEVNVCPVAVRLTYRFYHHLETFFFPHKSAGEPLDNPEFDPRGIGSKFLEVHIKNTCQFISEDTTIFQTQKTCPTYCLSHMALLVFRMQC